jgi:hypothetical protein
LAAVAVSFVSGIYRIHFGKDRPMKNTITTLAVLVVFVATVDIAHAQPVVTIDHVDPGATLPGHWSNDIKIATTGQYTGSQLWIVLTEGTIYQDAQGTQVAPSDFFIGLIPTLEFDSYFTNGGLTSDTTPNGAPGIGGGAINIGGGGAAIESPTEISQAWNDAPGAPDPINISDYYTARVTLSDNAVGTWAYLASDGVFSEPFGDVVGGKMLTGVIPEPSTLVLGGLSLLGLVCGRRRRS